MPRIEPRVPKFVCNVFHSDDRSQQQRVSEVPTHRASCVPWAAGVVRSRRAPAPRAMTSLVDVTVPPGVEAGGSLEFELNGTILFATVPEGMCEGMVFQVEVTDAAGAPEVITEYESEVAGEELAAAAALEQRLKDYVEDRAGTGDIMDMFVAWFERENIEEIFEAFIEANAHQMYGSASSGVEGEQDHAWWPLYQAYQTQFEALLENFLQEAQCTPEEFVNAAQGASGMNDIYLQIFLAQSEYEMFVELMSDEARKQKAWTAGMANLTVSEQGEDPA